MTTEGRATQKTTVSLECLSKQLLHKLLKNKFKTFSPERTAQLTTPNIFWKQVVLSLDLRR